MGVIKQGILGGFSGKVGNIVGASWKGIDYIRSLPTTVANPRTEGQVNQRNKFSATIEFLQPNLSFLQVGYRAYASGKSAFNAAMSYVIRNAITGTAPDFTVDYANALLSRGKLTGVSGGTATINGSDIEIDWNNNELEGNARADDKAMLLVYCPEVGESIINMESALRSTAAETIAVPSHFTGTVEVYLAFQAADGKMVSDSSHLASIALP